MCVGYCIWVEGCDLVVVQIGGDEVLWCELIFVFVYIVQLNIMIKQMFVVWGEILIDCCYWEWVGVEQFEVVCDVVGVFFKFVLYLWYQERNIQDVYLIGQDVIFELVLEYYDGVVG